jgi:hypothetical protein
MKIWKNVGGLTKKKWPNQKLPLIKQGRKKKMKIVIKTPDAYYNYDVKMERKIAQ